jgi:Gas vesicle synthesis protein GvpO
MGADRSELPRSSEVKSTRGEGGLRVSDPDSAATPRRRRTPRAQRKSANTADSAARPSDMNDTDADQAGPAGAEPDDAAELAQAAAEPANAGATADGDDSGGSAREEMGHRTSLVGLARRAAEYVRVLTGRHPESVISIERREGDWCLGVEVIETRRIPDSADILATYEVLLAAAGSLISYRRIRRYTRGQVDRPRR